MSDSLATLDDRQMRLLERAFTTVVEQLEVRGQTFEEFLFNLPALAAMIEVDRLSRSNCRKFIAKNEEVSEYPLFYVAVLMVCFERTHGKTPTEQAAAELAQAELLSTRLSDSAGENLKRAITSRIVSESDSYEGTWTIYDEPRGHHRLVVDHAGTVLVLDQYEAKNCLPQNLVALRRSLEPKETASALPDRTEAATVNDLLDSSPEDRELVPVTRPRRSSS